MSANRIRELRKEKGLTLKGLSQELQKKGVNLSASSIIKYERGERNPSLENWANLANFFDVSIDYLKGDTKQKNASIDEDDLVKSISNFLQNISRKKNISENDKKLINEIEVLHKYLITIGTRDDITKMLDNVGFTHDYLDALFTFELSLVNLLDTGIAMSNYIQDHIILIPSDATPEELLGLPGDLTLFSAKNLQNAQTLQKRFKKLKKAVKAKSKKLNTPKRD